MSSISLSGVSVVRGGTTVLEGVDLEVDEGEKVCLVGASGSGKTSLLRVIAGLDTASEGTVAIGGTPTSGTRRDVTMVFQDDTVYEHLDVSGNLDFPLRVTEDVPDRDHVVAAVASRFSIRRLLPRRPKTLSSGQRRVVAAARAVVRPEVSVVLLDEPMVGTDPHRRSRLVAAVMSRSDLTVVLSTNDPSDAMRWADRMVALDNGTIAQVGPPRAVHRAPISLAVADLTGEVNRVPASVTAVDGWKLVVAGSRLSVDPVPVGLVEGRRVVIGLRPSDLVPAAKGIPFDRRLRATVGRVETVGASQRVLFGLGDQPGVGFVAEVDATLVVHPGERLDWYVSPTLVRIYDPVSGRALTAG